MLGNLNLDDTWFEGALGVFFFLAILAVIAALVLSSRSLTVHLELELAGESDQALFDALHQVGRTTMTAASEGQFTLTRDRNVTGPVLAALLLFPFGLIFLITLLHPAQQLTFSQIQRDGRWFLRIVGTADNGDWKRISRRLGSIRTSVGHQIPAGELVG